MTPSQHWHLGVLTSDKSFKTVEQLTEDEFNRLVAAVSAVQSLTHDFAWSLLCKNYSYFREILGYHQTFYGLKHSVRSSDDHYEDSLYSSIINWLTSMHLHLDHAEAEINRNFGKESEPARELRRAAEDQYDGRFGYRFCYRLRNYYLHAGVPPFSERRTPRVADDPAWMKERFRLLLNRDELLRRSSKWSSKVTADIRELDETFEFSPLVDEAMDGLAAVHSTLVKIRVEHAMDVIDVIDDAFSKVEASGLKGQQLALRISRDENGDPTDIQPHDLLARHAKALRSAVSTADQIGEIIRVGRPGDRASTWSASLESGALNSSSVGCRLLLDWLNQGGSTPDFAAAVQAELQQPNGLTRVIGGLISTATALAHMTASMLGTESKLLLHDLGLVPNDAVSNDLDS